MDNKHTLAATNNQSARCRYRSPLIRPLHGLIRRQPHPLDQPRRQPEADYPLVTGKQTMG
ncbi:hypothetical protein [Chloroflexus sp.]|uniref:hypothetical protein n=1 Tax=Chloroflexus sp. TaxID=1904827 RepID=UPI002ADDABAA|nr:hypothetical protein [Chloroflexus sp.]